LRRRGEGKRAYHDDGTLKLGFWVGEEEREAKRDIGA